MRNAGANSIRNTVALVAHHYESVAAKLLGVDIVAIEESAVDGGILGQLTEQFLGFDIDNMYAGDATHGGLDYLGVPCIDGTGAAEDGINAEPIGDTDDSAEVSWILNVV